MGVWQREDNSTQMLLAPDGTGSYRTGQGDQSHFDWNADNKTLNFSEYGDAPTWNLAKLKRILAQDVSMGQSAEIVRLETNRLEIYWAKSERTIRYTKK